MGDLAKAKAIYKAKLDAATPRRARKESQVAPEAIALAQRSVAEQVSKLRKTRRRISAPKAKPEHPNQRIERLCELLQQREESQWERWDKEHEARERDVADKVHLFAEDL